MNLPENIILDFIKKHHVLTLATSENNKSWCCNCFYVFIQKSMQFLFTSDEKTKHINQALRNSDVSGSVVLETKIIGKIQGIQFTGTIEKVNKSDYLKYKLKYLKKIPYAVLNNTSLWLVNIDMIKMTDNRLGFGEKIYWYRNNQ